MKSADLNSAPQPSKHFRSLRRKVLLPFVVLVVVLSSAALWGTFHLAEKSFTSGADQRLGIAREIIFREFKKRENILLTYAIIMQQFQSLSDHFGSDSEIGILQDHLFNTLEKSDISTAFYPADIRGIIQKESLISLFDQVRRSGRERFRYSNEFGGTPVLMVAAPLYKSGEVTKVILLQTPMGDAFLRSITSALNLEASLRSLTGKIVARSSTKITDIELSPAQISYLGTGQKLFLDHDTRQREERHLFSIIPLGSSDMVLLSLETNLNEASSIQTETITKLVLMMFFAILVGAIFYFRQINSIVRPAKELQRATEALSRGDLNYRIVNISDDELGEISKSFNLMAGELERTYQERANQDIATALALEEDKTKRILVKKDLEKSKINEELSVLQREISALYQLNQAMIAAIDLNALFDRILQVLNDILACDYIVLLTYSSGDSILEIERASGLDQDLIDNIRFSFDQGITGEAAKTQRLIYVKNLDKDDRNLSYHGQFTTRGSLISVPLVVKNRLVGVINLHKNETDAFSLSEQKLIQAVANQTAIAIDNAQLIEKTREHSNTDELTGLSNRRHFQDILKREVAQARRFSSNFSIIMCDIDNFKHHKSTLGNMQSDALLRLIGQTLLKSTRGIDLVSRFGNDQFIILLPKTNKTGAMAAAEKLRLAVNNENYALSLSTDKQLNISISFGVAEFPVDSKNIYELLNLADRSLFAAKKDGGNCSVSWEGPAPGPD